MEKSNSDLLLDEKGVPKKAFPMPNIDGKQGVFFVTMRKKD
jgi:hypothetical protein